MNDDAFDRLVDEGYRAIPDRFREKIRNVVIRIEDDVSAATRAEMGLADDESLLGLYRGLPLTERGVEYGVGATYPDTITLYKLPILEEAQGDPERVRTVVAETIWHEFAHYFGMDEPEVLERERIRDADRGETAAP